MSLPNWEKNYNSLQNKVDKVEGKGLSSNDFTNEYKNKIDSNATEISMKTDAIKYNNWLRSYTVTTSSSFDSKLIIIAWNKSLIAYIFFQGRIIELGKNGTDNISYQIVNETQVTFTLSNTGLMHVINLTK